METKPGTIRLTASQKVHLKACEVYHITVCGNSTGAGNCDFYDGENTNEDLFLRVQFVQKSSHSISPTVPFILHKGLYVNLALNVDSVTIISKPL